MPEVWLRMWWSVIPLKNEAWNSGKYFESGSSNEITPCSANCNKATAENCLDTEAMQKLVSKVTGA